MADLFEYKEETFTDEGYLPETMQPFIVKDEVDIPYEELPDGDVEETSQNLEIAVPRKEPTTLPDIQGRAKKNQFVCVTCGKSFMVLNRFTDHVDTHNQRSNTVGYTCHVCSKTFARGCFRARHIHEHHRPDQEAPFPCHLCPKRFAFHLHLSKHLRTQHRPCTLQAKPPKEIKSLACSACDKTYNSASGLRYHGMLVHDAHPCRWVCRVCGQKFYTGSVLQNHLARRHNATG